MKLMKMKLLKRLHSMYLLFIYCLLVTIFSLFVFMLHNKNNNHYNNQSSSVNKQFNKNNKQLKIHNMSTNSNDFSNQLLLDTRSKNHVFRRTENIFLKDSSRNRLHSFKPLNNTNDKTRHPEHKQQQFPRTAHIIWFYPNSTVFRFHQALSLLSIQKFFKPSKIFFWHDSLPTGTWWLFACQSIAHLLFVPLQRPRQIFNWSVSVPEHQSDVARIQLLRKYGGLYVDLDVIILRDLSPLFQHHVTMGAETPDILGSGFILARPNATFLQIWSDSYMSDFDDSDWNKHSTKVPMELARRHPGLIHVEWFSINRPNWFERKWLYEDGMLWDWSGNYAVHLWYREHNVEYSPQSIRRLNTTVAEIFRFIYYQSPKLLPD